MLKVSFKDDFRKVQIFNDKATVITLTGKILCPDFMSDCLPTKVWEWINHHPSVEVSESYLTTGFYYIIKVSGKSVCSDNDAFDAQMGEKIAECRAKIRLYKFMRTLCMKLMQYYQNILYDSLDGTGVAVRGDSGGLEAVTNKYINLCYMECRHLDQLLERI